MPRGGGGGGVFDDISREPEEVRRLDLVGDGRYCNKCTVLCRWTGRLTCAVQTFGMMARITLAGN